MTEAVTVVGASVLVFVPFGQLAMCHIGPAMESIRGYESPCQRRLIHQLVIPRWRRP